MPHLLETLVLVTAVSVDAFVASIAYGTNRIRIPLSSVMVINGVCCAMLGLSLVAGALIRPFFPAGLTKALCFALLFLLGALKLWDSTLKAYIRRRKTLHKKLAFSFLSLNFILDIYANPEEADCDRSKTLSPAEAASLAVALSIDGLAVGFGAALGNSNILEALLFSLLINTAAVIAGSGIGNKIAEKLSLDLSWLSGLLLMVLAFLKL